MFFMPHFIIHKLLLLVIITTPLCQSIVYAGKLRTSKKLRTEPLKCCFHEFCNYTTTTPAHLNQHIQRYIKFVQCNICEDNKFMDIPSCRGHFSFMHRDEKNYHDFCKKDLYRYKIFQIVKNFTYAQKTLSIPKNILTILHDNDHRRQGRRLANYQIPILEKLMVVHALKLHEPNFNVSYANITNSKIAFENFAEPFKTNIDTIFDYYNLQAIPCCITANLESEKSVNCSANNDLEMSKSAYLQDDSSLLSADSSKESDSDDNYYSDYDDGATACINNAHDNVCKRHNNACSPSLWYENAEEEHINNSAETVSMLSRIPSPSILYDNALIRVNNQATINNNHSIGSNVSQFLAEQDELPAGNLKNNAHFYPDQLPNDNDIAEHETISNQQEENSIGAFIWEHAENF